MKLVDYQCLYLENNKYIITFCRLTRLVSGGFHGDKLFTVVTVDGFLCLLTISSDSLDTESCRPFSCVTREECDKSSVVAIGISPDLQVVYVADAGLQCVLRMELVTGNCRSFGQDRSCKYL